MPEEFSVTDRRASARPRSDGSGSGLVLGQSVADAKRASTADQALSLGKQGVAESDPSLSRKMATQRMNKTGVGGTNLSFATQRPQDPFFYWQQNNLPYDFSKPEELIRLRSLCRHIYRAHSVMASAIDIYSQWPVVEMEIDVKDKAIKRFYEELLFDQLDYEEFLPDLLREYWVVGEAFPLGSFNENLGVWEDDELINPDDVFVEKSPFVKDDSLYMQLPESLRRIITTQQPREQYAALMRSYPELQAYAHDRAKMPVSNVLLKHLKFKCVTGDTSILTPAGPVRADALEVGDEVVAWDTDLDCAVVSTVSAQGERAPEPVWSLETRQGRTLRATGDHPFWTERGWVQASDLQEGDRVRVGSDFDSQGESMDLDLARFLGVMVGDGSCGRPIRLHSVDHEIIQWTDSFVGHYGCRLVQEAGSEVSWLISQGPEYTKASPNQIRKLLQAHDLFGETGSTKRIPSSVWSAGRAAWVQFLAGYYDTDGHWSESGGSAFWTSANRLLMDDVQAMLSALGIRSRLVSVRQTNSYRVAVCRSEMAGLVALGFSSLLPRKAPVLREHKNRVMAQEQADEIRASGQSASVLAEQFGVSQTTIGNIRRGVFYRQRSGAIWDEVRSVSEGAPEPTMAIGIAGHHTHITAGLVTHNTDAFANRGLPIMYRALRSLMQEEQLNAAQDAIADRLYTPLILARIGASATDLGTQDPWVPTQDQIASFENSLDAALVADFRVLTTHFAVQMDSVFGRESMPNFDADFERLTERQLQALGLSKTMISGAGRGETYAADALNRDLVSQLLGKAQKRVKKFAQDRMAVVAEAQGHYDYEVRGGKRYPIMEEVLEVDEETGEQRIVEQPKLLIPDLKFRAMNMKDEENERRFIEDLRASGVPISQERRMVNISLDLEEEREKAAEEQIENAVENQRVRKRTYQRLKAEGLPIPDDLKADFDPKPIQDGQPQEDESSGAPSRVPTFGVEEQDTTALAPTPEDNTFPPGEELGIPAGPGGTVSQPSQSQPGSNVIPMPRSLISDDRARPEESDEMRRHMPKPGILKDAVTKDPLYRPDVGEDGQPEPYYESPGGLVQGPRHVGLRRYANVKWDTPLGEAEQDEVSEGDGSG